ncbi:MAG: hypothetical protein FJ265_00045 [Planctomycetes bacterium]|nr:hypothetical protein [Planctomycetota bacterium]
MTNDPLPDDAVTAVVTCLQRLGISYFVGGSVASTVHGEIRTTQGIDIVVELRPEVVAPLVACLRPDFFADAERMRYAIAHAKSCNVIHRQTGFKVDLILRRDRAFSVQEMQRRQPLEIAPGFVAHVASAEDCVLSKLEWYEKGGRASERQWRDVLGILKTQRGRLDLDYLRHWAGELQLGELLERARREAGPGA